MQNPTQSGLQMSKQKVFFSRQTQRRGGFCLLFMFLRLTPSLQSGGYYFGKHKRKLARWWSDDVRMQDLYINSKMNQNKTSKFFRAYVSAHSYKVFLDDVSAIYKVTLRKTPPLVPYWHNAKQTDEETDFSQQADEEML